MGFRFNVAMQLLDHVCMGSWLLEEPAQAIHISSSVQSAAIKSRCYG